jgi:hypothetical protein
MADMSLIQTLVNNPQIETYAKMPNSELTGSESSQVANSFAGLLRSREYAWLQYQAGILDKATFESYMETLIRMTQENQGFRFYWNLFSHRTNPEFSAYVNSMLAQEG